MQITKYCYEVSKVVKNKGEKAYVIVFQSSLSLSLPFESLPLQDPFMKSAGWIGKNTMKKTRAAASQNSNQYLCALRL